MSSWELLLGGDVEMPLRIKLENLEVYVRGDLAFVSCTEIVRAKGSRWGSQVCVCLSASLFYLVIQTWQFKVST
jgi:ketosteroid isomerase-like protein